MQKNIISQNKNISINDKPMTQKDKMALANYIRCLPEDQLKGIINLLDKNSEVEIKKGYYELDIEKLSDHKLRELEKYVKSCMKSSKNFIPLRYKEEFNSRKKIEKEKNKENSVENKVAKDNNDNNEEKENKNKEKNENDKEKNENNEKENIENNNKEENENDNNNDNNNENNENQNINQGDNIEIGIKT
jgi:Mg-chelatase subunit ChlI